MPQEIERKYLVSDDSWKNEADRGERIEQGYLSVDPERTVRVRLRGERARLTVKGPNDGPVRVEFEYEIPPEDAREILELCLRPVIHKQRHLLPGRDGTWEIDVFEGENAGLVVAEIELADAAAAPSLPPWIGADITDDPRYYNANLVEHPYCEWGAELREGS